MSTAAGIRDINPRDLSGEFSCSTDISAFKGYISWTATQDAAALTSKITVDFYIKKTGLYSSQVFNANGQPYSITIDGKTMNGTSLLSFANTAAIGTKCTIATVSQDVTHNPDGTKSVSISGAYETGVDMGTINLTGTATLDPLPVYVTVAYDTAGGSVSPQSTTVTYGNEYGELAVPKKEGHSFVGWYTELDGGSEVTSSTTVTATTAHTLYARWAANSYTLTLVDGDNQTHITQEYGTALALPAPSKECHQFLGWFKDSGLTTPYNEKTMPCENITLHSKWTAINATIIIDFMNGTTEDGSYVCGSVIALPAPVKEGHMFLGWFLDQGLSTAFSESTSVTGDLTLYPSFAAMNYTLTLNPSCEIELAWTAKAVTFNSAYGELPAPNRSGFTFLGWFNEKNESVTRESIVDIPRDHSLIGRWAEIVSEQVEIVFGSHMTAKDAEKFIKQISTAEFEILEFESESESNEARVIIKFVDKKDAEAFVQYVENLGESNSFKIKRAKYNYEELDEGSFSFLCSPIVIFTALLS